jgi:hypothetical protein
MERNGIVSGDVEGDLATRNLDVGAGGAVALHMVNNVAVAAIGQAGGEGVGPGRGIVVDGDEALAVTLESCNMSV